MNMQIRDLLIVEDRNYSIGELAQTYGVSLRTLRFYEEKGLVRPGRRGGHHRTYSPDDVRRLDLIINCREIGLSVETITRLLEEKDRNGGDAFQAALARALRDHLGELDIEATRLDEQRSAVSNWLFELSTSANQD